MEKNINSICFFYENTSFRLKNTQDICLWIQKAITSHHFIISHLNYIFCNDEYLHEINLVYLNHNTYTDIITFNNSDKNNILEGDIFISISRIVENKSIFNIPFEEELCRVIIHGILHLLGFEDKTKKQKIWMRKYEQKYINSLNPLAVARPDI